MKKLMVVVILLVVLLFSLSANAFRYGTELVQEGEYTFAILEKCGEPIHKELIQLGIKHSKIEHWMYEQNGYYYLLIFKSGRLDEIKSIRK